MFFFFFKQKTAYEIMPSLVGSEMCIRDSSSGAASAAGLTITSGVTSIFWVYCVFVIALLISCAWLFTAPGHPAMPAMTGMPTGPRPPIAGGDQAHGTVVGEP